MCWRCFKDTTTCYCAQIKPFESDLKFVILIHPRETKKRIGTGRFTHLCISNSLLISGMDFSDHPKIGELLSDPRYFCAVLYPSETSVDVSENGIDKIKALVPANKKLLLFVIDGTWASAKKMLRLSPNLRALPQICFSPPHLSNYRIRKQPSQGCFSTVEAVHFMIDQCSALAEKKQHQNLLEVFSYMVDQQLTKLEDAIKTGKFIKRSLR